MTPEAAPPFVTLAHTMPLLEEPALGSPTLAFLERGARLGQLGSAPGFVYVQLEGGRRGYLPAAACEPLATAAPDDDLPSTRVIQPVSMYRLPAPGQQFGARWIVEPAELLLAIGEAGRFYHIQRPNGQFGYVPRVLCRQASQLGEHQPRLQVVQPVSLYSRPEPGTQYEARWIIPVEESLRVLGKDGRFVLIQREDGQLGYVPAALCGDAGAGALFPVGPLDLGWAALGCGWLWANWGGLALALAQSALVDAPLRPYLGLGVVLGVVALLWFAGRRRMTARSFATGALLGYALLHLLSGGALTLWN